MSIDAGQEGGCQCGAIRFRLLREPVALYACHCQDCQKQSSSAFGISMWVAEDGIEFTGEKPSIFRALGSSGREKFGAFCSGCGTRLYHWGGGIRMGKSRTLSVKAGTLDDTSNIMPTSHIWTRSAQPWLKPLLDIGLCYAAGPESGEALMAQWRQAVTAGAKP
ncbi:MAG: GFA family protein [Gammaproteobacteria bacterium]|nr:GFA family protein [Gammaproteobacteria bacterium]